MNPGGWPTAKNALAKKTSGCEHVKIIGSKKSPLFKDHKPHVFEDVYLPAGEGREHAVRASVWLAQYDAHYGCRGWTYITSIKQVP